MNIDGVNLSSVLPGNSTIEGGAQSLPENGAIPENFSSALMGQIELLSETNGPAEFPGQLQSMTMPQTINDIGGDSLKRKGDEEEFIDLFNKYLPLTKKNEDIDSEATLLEVSDDALKSIVTSSTPDEVTTAQDMGHVMVLNGLSFTKPLPEEAKTPDEVTTVQDMGPVMVLNGLSFTKPLPEEATPPEEATTAQNMSKAIVSNGFSFAKPLPEETKLNMLGKENITPGDFLQKETVIRQLIQDKQAVNFQYIENFGPAEKMLMLEKHASILGIEQAEPGVSANMVQNHSSVDNRTDIPAITRPLTHPDWSKELGQQIIWMTNKAIPAAEIKLNPAHLGPISVRIDVNQDQASVVFTAQHAEVKEAIEASIPKLREMLGTQQLNLINVNISHNSMSDHGRSQSQTFFKTPENFEQGIKGVTDTIEKTENDRVVVSKGLLSIYA